MSPVAVVTDTTHYLPARARCAAHDIHEVSLYVNHGGEQRARGRHRRLRRLLRRACATAADLPTTSQPSIGDFLAVYEPLPRPGSDIVSVHIAGGISGTVESARQAAAELAARTRAAASRSSTRARPCGGLGLCALAGAAAAPRAGADVDAVARPRRASRRRDEDLVRRRHARVPAPRRAHRRRAGLARRRAEDQADPHDRRRDHARSSASAPRAARSSGMVDYLRRRATTTAPTRWVRPAHPGARRRPSASSSAAARSSAASRSSSPRSARSSAPTSARACSASAASRAALLERARGP